MDDYTRQLEQRIVKLENALHPFIEIWADYMELYAALPDDITFEQYAARRLDWNNVTAHYRSAWIAQQEQQS